METQEVLGLCCESNGEGKKMIRGEEREIRFDMCEGKGIIG